MGTLWKKYQKIWLRRKKTELKKCLKRNVEQTSPCIFLLASGGPTPSLRIWVGSQCGEQVRRHTYIHAHLLM